MAHDMVRRVGFAVVAIPGVVALVWLGGAPLAILVATAGALGCRELLELGRHRGILAWRTGALLAAAALPILAWSTVTGHGPAWVERNWALLGAGWVVLVLLATLARRGPQQQPLAAASLTLFAPLYAGGLPAFLLLLRHGPGFGPRSWPAAVLVLFPLVLIWIGDSAAMEVGRRIGGPKLAPVISPGKTWAGAIACFLAAILVAPLYQAVALTRAGIDLSAWEALAIGIVVGSMGQLGDLTESLFKRGSGVKDSSRLLPGHGGILDRLDSLYFAIPITAGLCRLFGVL